MEIVFRVPQGSILDNNLMKSNADKCHLLVSSNEKVTIKIGSHKIANTKREKLLGIHLDS